MARTELFDPIEPFNSGRLSVSERHQIYFEQCGRRSGVPVVVLHGGPGSGVTPTHRRFFDPDHYHIILFDQRGAGKSTPSGELRDNNTSALVDDIEKLRLHLRIEKWHIFGGSWGSTLALSYAQQYPSRCLSLCLRGIFLMRQQEIDWLLYGMRAVFPEAWRDFAHFIPEGERHDLLSAYITRLNDANPDIHMPAMRAWNAYESTCSTLLPNPNALLPSGDDAADLARARIEAHYFAENRFTPDDALLRGIEQIRRLPTTIIQGRYDMICPIRTADELHELWREADYIVVPDGGHSANDPSIMRALLHATEHFKTIKG